MESFANRFIVESDFGWVKFNGSDQDGECPYYRPFGEVANGCLEDFLFAESQLA